MSVETVPARINTGQTNTETGKSIYDKIEATYDFGDSTLNAVERFREEIVFANFRKSARIELQNYMRLLKESDELDIQGKVDAWMPGDTVRRPKVDAVEAVTQKFQELKNKGDVEGMQTLLAQIQGEVETAKAEADEADASQEEEEAGFEEEDD